MYASTGVLPKTLKLISAARLTGAQGIHRAENLAVLNCFEALREAVIHTNSAVTISMFEQCQQAVVEGDLLARSEFDLAARLLRCISPNSVPKKKAHRNYLCAQKLSLISLTGLTWKSQSQWSGSTGYALHLELQVARAQAQGPGSVETHGTIVYITCCWFRTSSPVAGWALPDFDFGLDPPSMELWAQQVRRWRGSKVADGR